MRRTTTSPAHAAPSRLANVPRVASIAVKAAAGCTGAAVALSLGYHLVVTPPTQIAAASYDSSMAAQLDTETAPLSAIAAQRAGVQNRAETTTGFTAAVIAERAETLERATRAAERVALEKAAAEKAAADAAAAAAAEAARIATASPRELGQMLAAERGWTGGQWSCLDSLWRRESNWNPAARNRSSGAFGIPQALPGAKMASAGADWATNPATQIAWGLTYIADRYGSPCGAWSHSESHNWY